MRPKHWNVTDQTTLVPLAVESTCKTPMGRTPFLAMLGLAASLAIVCVDASAQSTRGSAGGLNQLPLQLGAPSQTFGASGGTRGSAGGAVPNQPVNFARPVQGLSPTPDQISTTPQFGVAAGGSSPFLAGQASNAGLPLVSEDYEQLGGFDATPLTPVTGPAAAPSGPPQSFLAVPGSPYSQQAAAPSSSGPVSVGPGGSAPSGPPKSTLLVTSPSGIDYATLPSSLDSRPTQRSSNEGERNVSSTKSGSGSLPSLAPLKLPSSNTGGDQQTAKTNDDSSSETRSSPSLSLTPPSSGTTRPSLSLGNQADEGGDGDASEGDSASSGTALTIPKLPTLSLGGNGNSGSGLSLSTGTAPRLPSAAQPTNFQISGYRGGGTSVPAASLSQLNSLARAMASNPTLKVRLVSYAQPSGQISARTLSATRAVLVRKHLIQAGVDEERVSIRARGDNNGAVTSDRIDVEIQG